MSAPLDCPRTFGSDDSAPAIEDHPQVPRFHHRTTVEDYESDSEESHASSDAYDWDADLGDLYDAPPEELSDEDILPGEAIDGAFERQLAEFAEELTDDEIAMLRQFAFKVEQGISDEAFEKLEFVFPDSTVHSFKTSRARVAFLAAFCPEPVRIASSLVLTLMDVLASDSTIFPLFPDSRHTIATKHLQRSFDIGMSITATPIK
ncbi:hypothetical protein HGRIS_003267 [Hohenbuehelia grisea]|uniref:Uncharacterized protein n=1 Tax=Hohenbuehelia grisea TaxID=104357 RepID=A0ABR3JPT7_9AGAR